MIESILLVLGYVILFSLWFCDMKGNVLILLLHLVVNFKIAKHIKRLVLHCRSHPGDKGIVYLLPLGNKKYENWKLFFFVILSMFLFIFRINWDRLRYQFLQFATLIVSAVYVYSLDKLRPSEISNIKKYNNLDLGYGAALCYYENYLKPYVIENFIERVESFKTHHHVNMTKTLYILFPASCKIHTYIDDDDDIERCRELPALRINTGGIRGRPFNITVYEIRKSVRCAIEFAQPLTALLSMRNDGIICEGKLFEQRDLFYEELTKLLVDHKHLCELVKYDDANQKVHEVILGLDSVRKFMSQT